MSKAKKRVRKNLPKLHSIRAGHRNYVESSLEETAALLENIDENTIRKLKQLRITLKEEIEIIKDLEDDIVDLTEDEDELMTEIREAGEFRRKVCEALLNIEEKTGTETQSSHEIPSQVQVISSSSKLPKLKLKKFNGEVTQWLTFWDIYKSTIHDNPGLNVITKFSYLRDLLEGTAAAAIAGLQTTEANYDEAIDKLTRRFGDHQVIVSGHHDALLHIPPVFSSRDIKELRNLYDKVEVHVRGLKSLKVPTASYGSLLIPVLLKKIPHDVRLLIGRQVKDGQWDLDRLLDLLREEIENRERCGSIQADLPQFMPKSRPNSPEKRSPSTAAVLYSEGRRSKVSNCTYCRQEHTSTRCNVITDKKARKDILRKQGRCFICLRKNHVAAKCESKGKCYECGRRHHVSICDNNEPSNATAVSEGKPEAKDAESSALYVSSRDNILLQTAQAFITCHGKEKVRVRVIFDSGSQRSFICKNIKEQLSLPTVTTKPLLIKAFGGNRDNVKVTPHELVEFSLSSISGQFSTTMQAYAVSKICEPIASQNMQSAIENFDYLSNIELADYNDGTNDSLINLLIGADYLGRFFTGELKRGETADSPVAHGTKLGWVLSGRVPCREGDDLSANANFVSTHVLRTGTDPIENSRVDVMVEQLWDFESVGIREKDTVHGSFINNISKEGDKYCVRLPVKESHDLLPDNYNLSLSRMKSSLKRLRKDPETLQAYDKIIRDQERDGIIERVDLSRETEPGNIHYLPHQAVKRQDALTTKLRVVFDASSKEEKSLPSLNECMYVGPPMAPAIIDILLRFRAYKIGLAADIEKAFLNIAVDKDQRDLMRFLWIENLEDEEPKIIVFRFASVLFGMSCSPFCLNATLDFHVRQYYKENIDMAEKVIRAFYIDDWSCGAANGEEAVELFKEVKSCLAAGGFNLRKWATNDEEVASKIAAYNRDIVDKSEEEVDQMESVSFAKMSMGGLSEIEPGKEHKILGLNWDLNEDKIVLKLDKLAEFARDLELTKRNILRFPAKLFDPLGLIVPVIIPVRLLFQDLCRKKYNWDAPLSEGEQEFIAKWLKDLENVTIAVERCYLPIDEEIESSYLHVFGDASKKAYCAAVYLCFKSKAGWRSVLVASKVRLAPLSVPEMSIPRLELLAALISARLLSAVKEALHPVICINGVYCWTDSKCVLYWIKADKEYKQFVYNRRKEIVELTSIDSWRHCPGTENPADLGSRGCFASEIVNNSLWWDGPSWLRGPPECYPTSESVAEEEEILKECQKEVKLQPKKVTSLLIVPGESNCRISRVIDCTRFSTWRKLLRVTALVLKFIKLLKKSVVTPIVVAEDILHAEKLWIKDVQEDLKEKKDYYQKLEGQLGLFEENGIVRCRGRISRSGLPFTSKFPALLPRNHYITKLIVEHCHLNVFHGGVKDTLTELRANYWVPKGRQLVRKLIHGCMICRVLQGKSYRVPKPADLPEGRVQGSKAFCDVGIDCAGPLYIKATAGMQKAYVCLFTCSLSRAVHLEVVPNLSTAAFIRCLRRFIARRGLPWRITSDNAKTFKNANKEIGRILKSQEVQRFVAHKKIVWRFILERAPWFGGYYERMVQLMKRLLRKILGRARLDFEELTTVIAEVEGTINSRPLAYLNPEDFEEPLTPAHLVIGRRILTLPSQDEFNEVDEYDASTVEKRARYLRTLLGLFWRRWSNEYLLSLREHHHSRVTNEKGRDIESGDIVIVKDGNSCRGEWKVAIVEELIPSKDNEFRGAEIRVVNRKGTLTRLRRPIQSLFPIEVNHHQEQGKNINSLPVDEENDRVLIEEKSERPPKRLAAQNADLLRRLTVDQSDPD